MKVENHTPFTVERLAAADKDGADLLVVMLKAAYSFKKPALVIPADEQHSISLDDVYRDQPDNSSLECASDFSFFKPAADIALNGFAYADKHSPGKSFVGLKVGMLKKIIRVFGDRFWKKSLGFARFSVPVPFDRIPLVYERAFGGRDTSHEDPAKHEFMASNPSGRGFRAKKSTLPLDDMPLPNFEDPDNPISSPTDRPNPAGLGFIPPAWHPRTEFAGSYDKDWKENRMPLLPTDFDSRYFLASPRDLTYPGFFKGGEPVVLEGVSPKGATHFQLPTHFFECRISLSDGVERLPLQWDRLSINAEEKSFTALWSGCFHVAKGFQSIEAIEFNEKRRV